MATIYQIAKIAGVSAATVSRALNDSGCVRAELRDRIRSIAKELDYQPNSLARGLLNKRTYTLGLVMPDITNPFFPAVARGVEDVAHSHGYGVILCNTDGSPHREGDCLTMLRTKCVDGIIFIASHVRAKHLEGLRRAGIPVVLADRRLEGVHDSVLTDNVGGARQAVSHLLSLGHRAIAVVVGPANLATTEERLSGYSIALCEHGVEFDPGLVFEGDFRQHSGYELALKIADMGPMPTAVFAANDLMAVGALAAFSERGVRVPDDIALVGYDDIMISRVTTPRLTTVAQPKYEMGTTACETLLKRIETPDSPTQSIVLKPQLVVRESSVVRAEAG
ncbi:MAG: LacI family DNA-binding transcriptional regulator [Bacillota bacterium]